MIFSQDDGHLLFYDRFYPTILESEKNVSRTLDYRDGAFPKDRAF